LLATHRLLPGQVVALGIMALISHASPFEAVFNTAPLSALDRRSSRRSARYRFVAGEGRVAPAGRRPVRRDGWAL
jgi:hypothetical protein